MESAYDVAAVRRAEAIAMADLPQDTLMQRASFALAIHCSRILQRHRGATAGAKVVALVGSGNNGGDALWAGACLAARGVDVAAVLLSGRWHQAGAAALARAGGRICTVDESDCRRLIDHADIVLDGILGIGGAGALRPSAAELVARAAASGAYVVSVDLPSGIDADTGSVVDPAAAVRAQETVTFGCLKPGQLVPPGADFVGKLTMIDIGLALADAGEPVVERVAEADAAELVPKPGPNDDKYSRGVLGVVAGSLAYPGAGILCSGSGRLGGAGLVRYAGDAPQFVVSRWPEVVVASGGPAAAGRVQAWVVGPGAGTDDAVRGRLVEALQSEEVVVADADALTLIAEDSRLRDMIGARHAEGWVTVVTPHAGEFARLGFDLAPSSAADRIGAVKHASRELGAVVLLKGHHTVVAEPGGSAYVNTVSDSSLATAGSGDVLAGLLGSLLAAKVARFGQLGDRDVASVAACAALIHGLAGCRAAAGGRPVTAEDVLAAIPDVIAGLREDEDSRS